jgi:hypothetical protein
MSGKCPNCGATISGHAPGACSYCGGAIASDPRRPRTRSEEISYEVNGLCFSTLVILVIAGIAWQIGWGKIAAVIAAVWIVVLAAYSWHLYRKFSRR